MILKVQSRSLAVYLGFSSITFGVRGGIIIVASVRLSPSPTGI